MDPRLNEQESQLQERAAAAAAPVYDAAAEIDAEGRTSRELLSGLAAAGLLGVGVSEDLGGSGGGEVAIAIAGEEIGAASASVAALVAAHWSAIAMLEASGDGSSTDVFAGLVSGDRLATLVLDGDVALTQEPKVSVAASADGDSLVLSGSAGCVAGVALADVLVVPADMDGETVLAIVKRGADGVSIAPAGRTLGLNGAGIGTVEFADVAATRVGGDAASALEAGRDRTRIAHAALCVGIGDKALALATDHVEASDEGLDRAQSVQWMLADIATETEAARLLNWYAASREDAGERREATAMARLQAADAAVGASRRAVQVMGAAGNDSASGVERLYRDAKAMEVHHGASEAQRAEVARQLLPDLFESA